ncbi:MAG: MCE family protein [Acidobacteria bacterium]|nr:MCE family protein [Acidobacteriota bacterium]
MPRRNQKITVSDLRVGIFVLAALLLTAFLILNSTGSFNPFEKKMRLKARFVSADGLHPGADVQLAGVSIGKVESVRFLEPDSEEPERIEATLTVAQELDRKPISELIRTDSAAQLVATSVLGNDKMINISPGTSNGTPITENALLKSSASISLNQLTSTGNDLLTQMKKLAAPANEIMQKANRGDGTLGRIINDEQLYESLEASIDEIRGTMQRLQTTVDKVNRGEGTAGRLFNDPSLYEGLNNTVKQLEAISGDIKAGRGTAGRIVNDDALYNETKAAVTELRTAATKMSEIADDVRLITADLRDGKGTVGRLLKDEKLQNDVESTVEKLSSTVSRLDIMLRDAQLGKGTIGRLVTDETLYNSINQTANNVATFTGEGTKLLDDFRRNPKKYLSIKLSLF